MFYFYVEILAQIDKLEVVNKKWVRLKLIPGTQVDTVKLFQVSYFN